MGDADEAVALAMCGETRLRNRAQPTPCAIGAFVDGFEREGLSRALAGDLLFQNARQMVGMNGAAPIVGQCLLVGHAEKFLIGEIGEFAWAGGRGHPNRDWRAVGDDAETLLAFADRFKRILLLVQRDLALKQSATQ